MPLLLLSLATYQFYLEILDFLQTIPAANPRLPLVPYSPAIPSAQRWLSYSLWFNVNFCCCRIVNYFNLFFYCLFAILLLLFSFFVSVLSYRKSSQTKSRKRTDRRVHLYPRLSQPLLIDIVLEVRSIAPRPTICLSNSLQKENLLGYNRFPLSDVVLLANSHDNSINVNPPARTNTVIYPTLLQARQRWHRVSFIHW